MKAKKPQLIDIQSEREQSTQRKNNEEYWKNKFIGLSQENNQLLQKQKKYLQQLQILQSRIQKQNLDALELQSLYSQLMDKFKQKEAQIQQLIFFNIIVQLYYQPQSIEQGQGIQVQILKKQIEDLTDCLNEQRKNKLKGTREQRCICYKYFNSSIPSARQAAHMFSALQQKISLIGEQKARFQYENKFLVNRNKDLQNIRQDLNKILNRKQDQLNKTRDQYVKLIELEDATNKYLQKSNIAASCSSIYQNFNDTSPLSEVHRLKTKLQTAQEQIKVLSKIVSAQRQKIQSLQNQPSSSQNYRHQNGKNNEFFSFSQDKRTYKHYLDDEQQIPYTPNRHLQDDISDLPAFPKQLQIQELIRTMGQRSKKMMRDQNEEQDDQTE